MSEIKMILERVAYGQGPKCFKLWACRGEGKGCTRNKFRNRKIHCDDCVETNDAETLEQLQSRMERKG